jgi:di/tricarboxylate transporter
MIKAVPRGMRPEASNRWHTIASPARALNPALATVFVVLGVAVILMVTERLRPDLVALLMALVLALFGIITPQEAFSGFSQSAVITLVALYIMTFGLARSGATRYVSAALRKAAGQSYPRAVLATMVAGAGLSLFMTNVAAAAILLPAVMDLAKRTRTSPSRLLMPLGFSVNLGGMATLFATSNILMGAALRQAGLESFGLLDFVPTGLPLAVIGIGFVVLIGRRLLPTISTIGPPEDERRSPRELSVVYALEERLHQVVVDEGSSLAGKRIADSRIGEALGLNILAVRSTENSVRLAPGPEEVLDAGDVLLVVGTDERVERLGAMGASVVDTSEWNGSLLSEDTGFVEAIPAPRGAAAGRTLTDLRFREKYGLNAVAIWRGGRSLRTGIGQIPLQFGDALLLHGRRNDVDVLREDRDFLVLSEPVVALRPRRGWLGAGIMVISLAVAGAGLLSVAEAMLLGALAMVLVGCVSMDEAYGAVDWRVIFLVAGMLPLGYALRNSGAAAWLGNVLVQGLGRLGLRAVLAGIMFAAAAFSQFVPGQVATAILGPIAIAVAARAGAEPRAFAMGVAVACTLVYVTPLSHPVNMMVSGPGGYRFRHFFRAGLPLAVLVYLAALVIVPLAWPLA